MSSDLVTFVGGPLDLTRAAVDLQQTGRRYAVAVADRPVGVGIPEGSYVPDIQFGYATYRIETAFDKGGNEVHVGIFERFDGNAFDQMRSEVRRATAAVDKASKALENERIQHRLDVEALIDTRDDLKKKLADANGRLSSIGNVLSAKDPGPQQASARQMRHPKLNSGSHPELSTCAEAGCRPV